MTEESFLRIGAWLVRWLWRPIKQVFAARKGAVHPERSGRSLSEKSTAKTLAHLGAQQRGGAWYHRGTTILARLATKQGVFGRPYTNEWLSKPEVQALFDALHENDLAPSPRDPIKIEALSQSFQSYSGDNDVQAQSVISSVLGAMFEVHQASVRDKETVKVVQAGTKHVRQDLTALKDDVGELRADLSVRTADGARSFLDQQALKKLETLLIKRCMPGGNFLADLESLIDKVRTGEFSIVHDATKIHVLNWLARVRAWDGNVQAAQALLEETAKMGGHPDLSTRANLEAAKGDVERGLRLVQSEDTAECRSSFLRLLDKYRADVVEKYLLDGALDDPARFTAQGWVNAIATLLAKSRFDQVKTICSAMTEELLLGQPYLSFCRGVVLALDLVPDDRRTLLATTGAESLAYGSLDGPAAMRSRHAAIASFGRAISDSKRIGLEASEFEANCQSWIRHLRLSYDELSSEEAEIIHEEMMNPKLAIEAIVAAQAHRLPVNTSSLESYLDRQELLVGLSKEEMVARAVIFAVKERWSDLVDILDANWDRFVTVVHPRLLVGQMVDALTKNQDAARAEQFLQQKSSLISRDEADRLGLLIVQARGGDLAASAREVYEATKSLANLRNLVVALASQKRWAEAVSLSERLFEGESNLENAMMHLHIAKNARASSEDRLSFIEFAQPRIAAAPDFDFEKALVLFQRGRYLESKAIVDRLRASQDDARLLSLDLNLATQSGDWERFPLLLEQAWERRDEFDTRTLLLIANMAGLLSPAKALEIADEAARRPDADRAVWMNTYLLAVQLGQDEAGSVWLEKVIANRQDGDPVVSSHSMRQTMEVLRRQQEDWQEKSDDFRSAKYPIHFAAVVFNAPLTRFLVQIPRANAQEADARRRTPMPFRSGRRVPLDVSAMKSAVLDITTIFHADQFGFLGNLLGHFDEIHVASQIFRLLLEEKQQVAFHQPSRIEEAKRLLNWVDRKRVLPITNIPPSELKRKVGTELASLLSSAQQKHGLLVHDGPIYELGSYMESVAGLGDLQTLVVTPLDVACSLATQGLITELSFAKAKELLDRSPGKSAEGRSIDLQNLHLDPAAVGALQRAGVLSDLLKAMKVRVSESTILEWRSLVEFEGVSEADQQVIDRIRRALRAELITGKIRLLSPAPQRPDSFIGDKGMALFDLAANGGAGQFVALDDRLLNRDGFLGDLHQRQVPLATTLDLLDLMVSKGTMTPEQREEHYHQMRLRCMYCVPLTADSLKQMVSVARVGPDGELQETARLRAVREYLSCLIGADALCTDDDRTYFDTLWATGAVVIRSVWEDPSVPVEKAAAISSWVLLAVIPALDAVLRGLEVPAQTIEGAAALRITTLITALIRDEARADSHRRWADSNILGKLLPADGRVLDLIAARIESATLKIMKEAADDAARRIDA